MNADQHASKINLTDEFGSKGFGLIYVANDRDLERSYVYTVGLTARKLPELYLCGPFSPDDAALLIGTIAKTIIDHPALAHAGTIPNVLAYPIRLVGVNNAKRFFEAARFSLEWIEEHNLVAQPPLQIQLSDQQGRFPGDAGFDYFSPSLI